MSAKISRRSGALVAATIGFLMVGSALGVAQAQTLVPIEGTTAPPPPSQADISASARFDRPEYHVGDAAIITVTVTNKGTATAKHVRVLDAAQQQQHPNDVVVDPASWGDLAAKGPGVDLAAGASTKIELHTAVPDGAADSGNMNFFAQFSHDWPGAHNAIATLAVSGLVVSHGSLSGVVFYDRDGNGNFDPGEGVAGVKVSLMEAGVGNPRFGSAVTDANGTFHIVDVQVSCHWLEPELDSPWMLPTDQQPPTACVKRTNPDFVYLRVLPRNGVVPPTTASAPVTSVPATTSAPAAVETTSGVAAGTLPTTSTTTTVPQAANVPRRLANTGANVGPFLVVGTLALAAGVGAIVLTRLRRRASS